MRVIVTGGLGVNGSWVTRKLVHRGLRPLVLDIGVDFSLVHDIAAKFDVTAADVTNFDEVCAVLGRERFNAIIHLAAYIAPDMDVQPFRAFNVNNRGTANLLEAALRNNIKRFVYASSRSVYGETPGGVGEPGYEPVDEDYPKRPFGAYGVTKLASDQLGSVYRSAYGLEFAALRFAGIYGPGKQARHGALALRSRLIEDPFEGKRVAVPSGGDQVDDMIYVDDVAEALVRAALVERLNHSAYNVASGKGQTLKDFANAVRKSIPDAQIEVGPGLNYYNNPVNTYAIFSIERARQDFGFEPRFDLNAGVAHYVDILRQRSRLNSRVLGDD
jgi:UDP-glucose 4-epimerase